MPHQTHLRKFSRTGDQRRAMLRNLSLSVLRYERVKTTEAKAKEVRRFVDRMINLGKDGSLSARRRAAAWLPEPVIVEKVFTDLANRYPDRRSGYLHMVRMPRRHGDSAPLMQLELATGVEAPPKPAPTEGEPKRRRLSLPGRGRKAEADEGDSTTGGLRPPRTPRKAAARATKTTAKKATTTGGLRPPRTPRSAGKNTAKEG